MIRTLSFEDGIGNILDLVLQSQAKTKRDYWFLIGGPEGLGKSNIGFVCIDHVDQVKGEETPITNIAGNLAGLARAMYKSGKGSRVQLDEAKQLENINWNDKDVKEFNKMLTTVRIDEHLGFICFRNPAKMIGYLKNDKVFAVFIAVKKGLVYVYSRERFNQIVEKLEIKSLDNIIANPPNFKCRVPEYKGRLREEYALLKQQWVRDAKKEFFENTGGSDEPQELDLLKSGEAAKMLSISKATLKKYVEKGVVKPHMTFPDGMMKFTRTHLQEVLSGFQSNQSNHLLNPHARAYTDKEKNFLSGKNSGIIDDVEVLHDDA